MRAALRDALPGIKVFYFTGGIVKRILNFGAPAPIDVEILGYDLDAGRDYAKQSLASCARCATRGADRSSPTCRSRARRTTRSSTSSSTARRPGRSA